MPFEFVLDRDGWDYAVAVAQVITAAAAILLPFSFAWAGWLKRPRVEIREDADRIESKLEGGSRDVPHIRLLASNPGRSVAAGGSRRARSLPPARTAAR